MKTEIFETLGAALNPSTTIEAKNSLIFKEKVRSACGNDLYINIRLNDECRNGHQDFAITADLIQCGKSKIDRYLISGGCIHEDILAAKPEYKIFVDLHLCDYKGNPSHPVANGYYHLKEGFNTIKPQNSQFAAKYCEEYRITSDQFNVLKEAKSKVHFYILLRELNIFSQWETQANEAIKLLENMTGSRFLCDSKRTQLIAPDSKDIKKEIRRLNTGYYSDENIHKRELKAQKAEIKKLKDSLNKELNKAKTEYKVKEEVLKKGGTEALDNCIFYNHSSTLSFNWRGYKNLSREFLDELIPRLELPEGVKVEVK